MGVWDKTTPSGSDPKSQGDDRIREMKIALEEALQGQASEGDEAIFPGSSPSTAPVFRYRGLKGATGARPASGQYGLYFDSTRNALQRDNGSTWDDIANVIPAGSVMDYAGSSAPADWLLCDGSAVSRTTYAALFAVIGTTYGVGDGSTTFNLPDARGRTSIGAGTGTDLTARTLAGTGGEENHVLSTAEMPSHGHNVSDPGHTHGLPGRILGGSASGGVDVVGYLGAHPSSDSAGTGISINNSGSGSSHNNMQPYLVLNKIIKC